MKAIKLQYFALTNKRHPKDRHAKAKYRVPIGNGYVGYFNSKRECLAFLADTNRVFNFWVLELNQLYAQAYFEYRQLWPLFDRSTENRLKTESIILYNLNSSEKKLDLMYRYHDTTNGNYWVVRDLTFITECLEVIFDQAKKTYRHKSNAVAAAKCEALVLTAKRIARNIEQFGFVELEQFEKETTETILRVIS